MCKQGLFFQYSQNNFSRAVTWTRYLRLRYLGNLKASTKQEVKLQDLVVPVNNKHLDHFILIVYFAIHLYLEALEMLKYLSDYIPGLARSWKCL